MKVGLAGGAFEADPIGVYARSAPEIVLRRFLEEEGHDVVPLASRHRLPLDCGVDLFHVHHFGSAACHLALAGVRPFVFTSHDPFLVSEWTQRRDSRVDHALRALIFRRADAVVALSRREAERLAATFGAPPEKFVVIPNGLDLSLYGPAGPRRDGGVELLSVGQLMEYKGHPYLFDALALLAPRLPALRLRIVTHHPLLREQYERCCRELGIADRVLFEGPMQTEELVGRYRACDVYVQPSLAECFPVTVLEAMACGKPVVATDVGGVAEEVGDVGVVVPPGDADALAAAIERLARDEGERRARGERALARVRDLYDGRLVASRHAELYAALAERTGGLRLPGRARRLAAETLLTAYERRGAVGRFVPELARRRRGGRR